MALGADDEHPRGWQAAGWHVVRSAKAGAWRFWPGVPE